MVEIRKQDLIHCVTQQQWKIQCLHDSKLRADGQDFKLIEEKNFTAPLHLFPFVLADSYPLLVISAVSVPCQNQYFRTKTRQWPQSSGSNHCSEVKDHVFKYAPSNELHFRTDAI